MVIRETKLKDLARLIIWFPWRYMVPFLPPTSEFWFYTLMGRLFFAIAREKRKVILSNLSLIFDSRKDTSIIGRKYCENHFIDRYLSFSYSKLNPNNIEKYICFEGIEILNQALKKGKGCILTHAHFGPTQLPLFALGLKGYKVTQIGAPDVVGLSKFGQRCLKTFRKDETLIPANIYPANSFLRPIIKALERNEIVMTAGDGTGARRGIGKRIPLDIWGYKLKFPIGPASLALKTGAPLLTIFTLRVKGKYQYKAIIDGPIQIDPLLDKGQTLRETMTEFAKIFAHYINQYPCHWHFWDELDYLLEENDAK